MDLNDLDRDVPVTDAWRARTRAARLRYFLPDWDDLVDPAYDFEADVPSRARLGHDDQVYAHQLHGSLQADGLLVSKVVAESRAAKRDGMARVGVHRWLRVPREVPVMGDCGAFEYIEEDDPPFDTDEVIEHYARLGFDYGVSVDHLVFGGSDAERRRRWELTLHNAAEFLREHRAGGHAFEPVGAVQGWDPSSYAEGARQVVAMGYRTLGLGGLVRTRTPGILATLDAVRPHVPPGVNLHVFGLGRLNAMAEFAARGVTSVDSASWLRQAWMRTKTGYRLADREWAALRIPQTSPSFLRKAEAAHGVSAARARELEAAALAAVRAWARRQGSLEGALEALLTYDELVTADRVDLSVPYRRTLEDRPWERCDCAICRAIGVEVVIFRGNNRNRRRGFHNTHVFYRALEAVLAGEAPLAALGEEDGDD